VSGPTKTKAGRTRGLGITLAASPLTIATSHMGQWVDGAFEADGPGRVEEQDGDLVDRTATAGTGSLMPPSRQATVLIGRSQPAVCCSANCTTGQSLLRDPLRFRRLNNR